jgi:ethanolamine-phosphate cytidylyltransferase
MRERSLGDAQNHSSLQRQFSHGNNQTGDKSTNGTLTKISNFLPTSRRIVQFSNGKVVLSSTYH